MSTLLQALYEGLINGTIYALIAMGIALVWGFRRSWRSRYVWGSCSSLVWASTRP